MIPTILIIDDDLVSQFATRYSIEQNAIKTSINVCDSAEEALTQISNRIKNEEGFPEVILLDLVMPGMGGWEFIEKLQKVYSIPKDTKIFILSAFTNSKDRKKAKEHLSIAGYYDKPLTRNSANSILTTSVSLK